MKLTPRERVMTALEHRIPDRIPAYVRNVLDWEKHATYFGVNTLDELKEYLGNTIISVEPEYIGPKKYDPQGRPLNAWGTLDGQMYKTYSALFPRPLAGAESAADVEAYHWPSPDDFNFTKMRKHLEADTKHARIGPSWSPVFSRLLELFGMEQALMNFYLNPVIIEAALSRLDHFYTNFFQRELDTCSDVLDLFGIGDDFAENRKLFISPDHWRKYFKPLYAKWFEMAKKKGLKTFMHACGAISEVLPDLIDIGLDAWQTVQTHLPGNEPERIKREFGHHLTFVGAINTTHILGKMTPDEVRAHVREQILKLGKSGGYICSADHTIMPEVSPENVAAMYEEIHAFRRQGYTGSL